MRSNEGMLQYIEQKVWRIYFDKLSGPDKHRALEVMGIVERRELCHKEQSNA